MWYDRGAMASSLALAETFTPDERKALTPYFTNLDSPVFALINLPEVVKGALLGLVGVSGTR